MTASDPTISVEEVLTKLYSHHVADVVQMLVAVPFEIRRGSFHIRLRGDRERESQTARVRERERERVSERERERET